MGARGREKARDMARSALPASRRHAEIARAYRKSIHGAVRAHERAVARVVLKEDPEAAEITGTLAHGEFVRRQLLRNLVGSRQGGDRLGHLFRWMRRHFRGTPAQHLRKLVRAVLPDDTSGYHAWNHLESVIREEHPEVYGPSAW
jgi:hypothetical protein